MAITPTPREIARAAETLNRYPGLSPMARRLGFELINRTDRNTGRCRPSEGRLAISLGCDERSIRRAKVELQKLGFLAWRNPGHHKRSIYQIMWTKLGEVAQRLKAKIREAATPAMAKARTQRAIKMRRYFMAVATGKTGKKSDRTKMSGNPTTHIIQSIAKQHSEPDKRQKALRVEAEQRFWDSLGRLPTALSQRITTALSEAIFERALEAETRLWGSGVPTAIALAEGKAV